MKDNGMDFGMDSMKQKKVEIGIKKVEKTFTIVPEFLGKKIKNIDEKQKNEVMLKNKNNIANSTKANIIQIKNILEEKKMKIIDLKINNSSINNLKKKNEEKKGNSSFLEKNQKTVENIIGIDEDELFRQTEEYKNIINYNYYQDLVKSQKRLNNL